MQTIRSTRIEPINIDEPYSVFSAPLSSDEKVALAVCALLAALLVFVI